MVINLSSPKAASVLVNENLAVIEGLQEQTMEPGRCSPSYEKNNSLQQEKQRAYQSRHTWSKHIQPCDLVRQLRVTLLLQNIVTLWEDEVISFQGLRCVDVYLIVLKRDITQCDFEAKRHVITWVREAAQPGGTGRCKGAAADNIQSYQYQSLTNSTTSIRTIVTVLYAHPSLH